MDWKPPTEFPNLSGAKVIAYDTETKDPTIKQKGPGNIRAKIGKERGHVVGVSIGVGEREGEQWYFPFAHLDVDKPDENNMDPDQVRRFLNDVLGDDRPKLGTNLLYDLGWLATEGVHVGGKQYDIQIAEPLIDENMRSYALSILCAKYGTEGKDEHDMYAWQAEQFGGKADRSQAKNIWRTPSRIVGPYAESDVREPFAIFEKQRRILAEQELGEVFDVETRLIPLLHAMRERGVLVDIERANEILEINSPDNAKSEQLLKDNGIDVWASATIQTYCEQQGIEFPHTEKGAPSFTGDWLADHDDEVLRRIADVRRFDTNVGKFVSGSILGHSLDGRLHCSFNQLRSDSYGTVTGRFSSSNPNLQNIPRRDEEIGPLIRGLFLPDPGEIWFSDDWSQIEYRLLVHYAVQDLPRNLRASAEKAASRYHNDPDLSFHKWVAELTNMDYDAAKSINFGLAYGMGKKTMAENMGVTEKEAAPIFDTYHKEVPFVRELGWAVKRKAENVGFIRTMLGRRRRFDLWEPKDWDMARAATPMSFLEARNRWGMKNHQTDAHDEKWYGTSGKIKRAYCYKALNSLLQGSAADIMKVSMVEIWESGVCDVLGAPLLTVHDELNWSVPDTPEGLEAHAEAVKIMNDPRGLNVPMKTDVGQGATWAEAH
jgi:DNA polymerase I-like protein with 3'-5' exonuclease and polymerase domains